LTGRLEIDRMPALKVRPGTEGGRYETPMLPFQSGVFSGTRPSRYHHGLGGFFFHVMASLAEMER
jgi:hypothetical protein